MKKICLFILLILSASAFYPSPGEGEWSLGADGRYDAITGQDFQSLADGPGLGINFRYRSREEISPGVKISGEVAYLFGSLHHSGENLWRESGLVLTGGIHFWPARIFQPYLLLGAGVYEINLDADTGFSGPGAHAGGGAEYFIKGDLSVYADLVYRWIQINKYKIQGASFDANPSLIGNTVSARAGLRLHF